MIQCQNCGQVNNYESNFCRFCGTKMASSESQRHLAAPYETQTPRPYVWKTDEFQLPENAAPKSRQINQVQLLANFTTAQNQFVPPLQQPMTHFRQPATPAGYGYRCPRCATQSFPYVTRKISNVGWVIFAIFLVVFFPLFWIGLLIKDEVRICPVCGLRVG